MNRACAPLLSLLAAVALILGSSTAWAKEPSQTLKDLQDTAAGLYRMGAYREALEASRKTLAQTIAEFGPDDEQVSIQTYGMGLVAEAAGEFREAEASYRETLRIREKVYGPDSAVVTTALERLAAVVLKLGRPDEAEGMFDRVLRMREAIVGRGHSFSASAYSGLGDVDLARGKFTAALSSYRQSMQLLTASLGDQVIARSVADADVRRQRDTFIGLARAAWGANQQGAIASAAATEEAFVASQWAWATSAASALSKMSARLKASQSGLGQRVARLQDAAERVLALHDEDMQALRTWSAVQRADRAYSEALEAFRAASIERGRANAPVVQQQKELVDRLQELLRKCPGDSASAGCANRDRDRDAITNRLNELAVESSKGSQEIMRLNQRLQAAEKVLPGYAEFTEARRARLVEINRLEKVHADERAATLKEFPDYLSLAEPKPLSIAETRALLKPDEALVSILVGSEKSFAWAVTAEGAHWMEIAVDQRTLEGHVAALRLGLDPETPPPSGTAASPTVLEGFDLNRSYDLYKLILAPLEPALANKRHLLIVPTGPLSSLPFQVLLTAPPAPQATPRETLAKAPWLVTRHALSVLPSVQSLASLRRIAAQSSAPNPFYGVGDPVLGGPPPDDPQKRGLGQTAARRAAIYRDGRINVRAIGQLLPLPETALEITTIARSLGAAATAISLREQATETRVKSEKLDGYRIIQFATHGLVAGDLSGLQEPALVLTPPEEPSEMDDGLLTASEIATLRLNADWVVLSACNTASGETLTADALSGLARAFFFAGARALLVSHWAVYSEAAVRITTRTFETMAGTPDMGRAEALRHSLLELIAEGKHPSYWAPFVVVGEGGRR